MRQVTSNYTNDSYLYAMDFSNTDLRSIVFDKGCKMRCYRRDMPIAPFNLTNTIFTKQQMLRFIKHGVADMRQINWDIQDEDVKQLKHSFIALAAVMYASRYSDTFSEEAFRSSFRLSGRHQNVMQNLIDRIDLNKPTASPGYISEHDFGTHHIDDVIRFMEQRRLILHAERRQTPGLSGYYMRDYPFTARRLDDQLLTADKYTNCTFTNCSLQRVHFEDRVTTFEKCSFSDSQFNPITLASAHPHTHVKQLNLSHCTWQDSHWTSTKAVSCETKVSKNIFTQTTFSGDFSRITMTECTFKQCSMQASFTGATLSGSRFDEQTLTGSLQESICDGAVFTNCRFDTNAQGANFSRACISGCDLTKLQINNKTRFSDATITNCVVNTHQQLMTLVFKHGVSLNSFDWSKMTIKREPYERLQTLYINAKRVGEAGEFIAQTMCGNGVAASLTNLQHMGQRRHSWCSLFHRQRNNYFGKLKAIKAAEMATATAEQRATKATFVR